MKKFKYLLNLQMFAEPGEGGGAPAPGDPSQPVDIDYDKLAEAMAKRTAASENSALKGYLKDLGLSKEEVEEAAKTYKANQAQKQKQKDEEYQRIIDENTKYKKAETMRIVKNAAKEVAKELNVRDDRFDKLFRLSDTSKFLNDDKVDKDAIKNEFEEQLKDLPEFTSKKNIVISTGDGFNGKPREATDAEEYRKRKYGKNRYFKG